MKDAYRDLVKVWHPDRFGSDPRLRDKAEQKLKVINDAYQLLRGGQAQATASAASDVRPVPSGPRIREHDRVGRGWVRPLLLYSFVGFFLIAAGTYVWLLVRPTGAQTTATPVVEPAEVAADKAALKTGEALLSAHVRMRLGRAEPLPPQVRVLSEVETAQVEAACASERRRGDTRAYAACERAQLAWREKYEVGGSGLSTEERDSLASACSTEKTQHDEAGYDRCIAFYNAELETAPDRPNLVALSGADRSSMEAACAKEKNEGPASYDRCLMRFVRLLAKAR